MESYYLCAAVFFGAGLVIGWQMGRGVGYWDRVNDEVSSQLRKRIK